jgi:hypothetical protein
MALEGLECLDIPALPIRVHTACQHRADKVVAVVAATVRVALEKSPEQTAALAAAAAAVIHLPGTVALVAAAVGLGVSLVQAVGAELAAAVALVTAQPAPAALVR